MHVTVAVMAMLERECIPKQTRVQVKNNHKINSLAVDKLFFTEMFLRSNVQYWDAVLFNTVLNQSSA